MDMGVDEAWSQVRAAQVQGFLGFVIIVKPNDKTIFDGNAGIFDNAAAQDIHNAAACQLEVAERSAGR